MIKDTVDQGFTVEKAYSGITARVSYSRSVAAYYLTVESEKTISEGVIHRCLLDLGVNIVETIITLDRLHKYAVEFPED